MRRYLEKILFGLLNALPDRLVSHMLFLLRGKPYLADRWGYHIRPIHFYEPLPDFQHLHESQFSAERTYPGIDFRLSAQLSLFENLGRLYRNELVELASDSGQGSFNFDNDYFSGLDACLYYSLIRDLKPARIIEIGAGYSTQIASKALEKNRQAGNAGQLIAIEPFPQARLTQAQLAIDLIENPVEEMDAEFFSTLSDKDILFIDSSHAVSFGSDVCKLILEIIPVLKPGVWIHVHDIFFPHDYPAQWLMARRLAFNEQYMLEAFLTFNNEFKVCAANNWMYLKHGTIVRKLCPQIVLNGKHMGSASFWMCRSDS